MATLAQQYTNGKMKVRDITDSGVTGWNLVIEIDGDTLYMSFDEARALVAALVSLIPNTTPTAGESK
jgi:hypothetical protein